MTIYIISFMRYSEILEFLDFVSSDIILATDPFLMEFMSIGGFSSSWFTLFLSVGNQYLLFVLF